jgi:hypothetical protein
VSSATGFTRVNPVITGSLGRMLHCGMTSTRLA